MIVGLALPKLAPLSRKQPIGFSSRDTLDPLSHFLHGRPWFQQDVDMIVVGMKPGMGIAYDAFARTMDVLMRHAPCELLIDRVTGEGTT